MSPVRSVLPAISVPTLVMHAIDDVVPIQFGRYLADHIPGATLIEASGRDHAPWFSEPDRIAGVIEQFLTGSQLARAPTHRALRTLLFADMVGSTARAAAMGDERWRALLESVNELTASLTTRFGGNLIKNMGDGTSPRSKDPPRPSVVGSGIGDEDRGAHELRGVPGPWSLLAVPRDGAAPGSREAQLAALPTPAPADPLRRTHRAAAVIARRIPRLARSDVRLMPLMNRR